MGKVQYHVEAVNFVVVLLFWGLVKQVRVGVAVFSFGAMYPCEGGKVGANEVDNTGGSDDNSGSCGRSGSDGGAVWRCGGDNGGDDGIGN